ncbi:MAG: glycosyltransferase family 39 protein [Candidatus Rokubacteria bacterium]|nr:glycosyltransferase family 39 protein [Candidatus Rokubacteria bacterium]
MDERAAVRWLWVFLGVVTGLRIAYLGAGVLDLSPDEAHYWEWSRRLDLSYYSKGPLVAYLIRALTTAFGTSAISIRLGAVLLSLVGSLITFRLAREAFGDARAGLLAVVGLQLTPLVWAGSLLMTIDAPFLTLWTLALLLLYRGIVGGGRGAWLAAGAAVGLGLLAKYTMLFVLPGLALYLLRAPEARRWLMRPPPYLAAAIALALFVPVLVWNLRHGWVSARHVASQGLGGGLTWVEPLEFAGSQVLVLTPLVAGILGWGLWHGLREGLLRGREPYRFLTAFAAPILGFYLLLALQGKVQANWPAAAYPPLALVAAGALLARTGRLAPADRRRQRALLGAAGGLALAVIGLGHATDVLGIPPWLDPTTRLKGWHELGAAVTTLRRAMPAPERTFLVSDRYQITSELAFYVEGRPRTYNVNLGRRLNQYDFWEGPDSRLAWDAIYVREGVGELDERVVRAFERTEGPVVVEVRRRDRPVRMFVLYRGYGFRGMPPPPGAPSY